MKSNLSMDRLTNVYLVTVDVLRYKTRDYVKPKYIVVMCAYFFHS